MANIVHDDDDDHHHHHHHEAIGDPTESNNPKLGVDYNYRISNIHKASSGWVFKGITLIAAISFGCFLLLSSQITPIPSFLQPSYYSSISQVITNEPPSLDSILQSASMKDKNNTVILTILNEAWAKPNSIFDLFLESFRIGNGTSGLVKHLVVICIDDKAFERCSDTHPHCYRLRTSGANFTSEASFMSPSYLDLVWRKVEFLSEVLEMGYSFLFTDCDIMWFRNPFPHFFEEADFQISCDRFKGNTYDLKNLPNAGFQYIRSNFRTINFYKFWYFARVAFPGSKTQDVFNRIKFDSFTSSIGVKIRFLDPDFFGGFCQPSRDLNRVCTMHANCCVGLGNKINDLKLLLNDWRKFKSSPPPPPPPPPSSLSPLPSPKPNPAPRSTWSVPKYCRSSFPRPRQQKSGHTK